jgi:transcriptional regulator with XRE-family HTH domain
VYAADQTHPAIELASLCIEHGVSVKAVAEKLGVTRATVYSWFAGTRSPRPEMLSKVVRMRDKMRTIRARA